MRIEYPVYNDGEIAVALFAEDRTCDEKDLLHLAVRWLQPKPYKGKEGKMVKVTNVMGGETEWFILPTSFGYSVAKGLIIQKVAGRVDFDEAGFQRMVSWLLEMEQVTDAMCY